MQNDYAQLLLDVQKKSNVTVNKSRDLRFLKKTSMKTQKLGIGFNTLRRLFGFLEKTDTKHQHTKYTSRLSRF